MISRLRTRFDYSVTVCGRQRSGQPRVTTPAQYRYIHSDIPCTLRHRFRKAALASRNIPGMRRISITGHTVWNRLREINPLPTGLQ